jgi:hypothetical protein
MFISSTPLLLLLAIALAAAAAAAAGQQTWHATLIAGSQQGGCGQNPFNFVLVDDFTVVYRGDDFGAYPPVLFADASSNGVYLGGALASAAGYAYGWTWAGTCVYTQQAGQTAYLVPSLPCNCNVNLQPAGGSDSHDFAMYMSCSVCPSGACSTSGSPSGSLPYTIQCLANYKLVAVNASSVS